MDVQLTEWLLEAARIGSDKEVKRLIPRSDSFYDDVRSLLVAAENGHVKCVQLLISFSDPQHYFWALYEAASNGHTECVEELLNHCNPCDNNSSPLKIAAARGHTECFRLLIPLSDPKADASAALQTACEHGHQGAIDALFDVSDVNAVLERLHKTPSNQRASWQYLEEKINQRQNQRLNTEIDEFAATKSLPYRKM